MAMKPKPFSALNHFTVPCATCAPTFRATDDPSRSGGRVSALPPVRTRTWNANRAERYDKKARNTGHPRGTAPFRAPPRACEGWGGRSAFSSTVPAGPRRVAGRLDSVRGPDEWVHRVERLQALP